MLTYQGVLRQVRRAIQVEGYRRRDPRTGREVEVSPYTREGNPAREELTVPRAPGRVRDEVRPFLALPGTAAVLEPSVTHVSSPFELIASGREPHLFDFDRDGVADAARVGVPARELGYGRVPRLSVADEDLSRRLERYHSYYQANRDKMIDGYLEKVKSLGAPVFSTDDAKYLIADYALSKETRSEVNVLVHQIANAVAKQAFVKYLDSVPEDKKTILVTAGGVAAGKSMALKTGVLRESDFGAVWDAAGEQNSTEMPWVLDEARKRGFRVTYLFVDADPRRSFDGMLERAVNTGRTVDSLLFAESYVFGANNFRAFYEKHKNDPDVRFVFFSNRQDPKLLPDFPREALRESASDILRYAYRRTLEKRKAKAIPPPVFFGAVINRRIWGGRDMQYLARARQGGRTEPMATTASPGIGRAA